MATVNQHRSPITDVAFDTDSRLYTVGYDSRVCAWEADGRTLRWQGEHRELVNSVVTNEDQVFTASADRTVRIWAAGDGQVIAEFGGSHRDDLNTVVVEPSKGLFALGGEEGRVVVMRLKDGQVHWEAIVKDDCINALAFVRINGDYGVASGGDGGPLSIFDSAGRLFRIVMLPRAIESLATTADGRLLAVGLEDGQVALVQMDRDGLPHLLQMHDSAVRALTFSSNGSLVTAAYDRTIHVASSADGSIRQTLEYVGEAWRGWSRGIAIDPRDPNRLASSSLSTTPQIWNLSTGTLETPDTHATPGLNAIELDPEGGLWAAGDSGVIWRISNAHARAWIETPAMINGMSLGHNGQYICTAAHDGQLRLYAVGSKEILASVRAGRTPVNCVRFAPSGDILAAGLYSGEVQLRHRDLSLAGTLAGATGPIKDLTFTDDGSVIAAACADGRLLGWNMPSGSLCFAHHGLYLVDSVAWDAAGRRFATVGRDCILRLWNSYGSLITQESGHDRSMKGLAFSPNGQFVATTSYDRTVQIWQADPKLVKLARCRGHDAPGVPVVRWLDNDHLITAGWDGTVRTWSRAGNQQEVVVIGYES